MATGDMNSLCESRVAGWGTIHASAPHEPTLLVGYVREGPIRLIGRGQISLESLMRMQSRLE